MLFIIEVVSLSKLTSLFMSEKSCLRSNVISSLSYGNLRFVFTMLYGAMELIP